MELQKEKNINKYTLIILISLGIFMVCSLILIYNYYDNAKMEKVNEKSVENFFDESIVEEETQKELPKKEEVIINYKAILEIPKINLKRGIVDKDSSLNNVDRNIYTLKETTYPDEEVSHIILASHAGTSSVAYFKNLNKLSQNDEVYFYFNGIKYIYKIINRYEIEKTGKLELKLTDNKDITLVSCIFRTNKQVVFVANLERKEFYGI